MDFGLARKGAVRLRHDKGRAAHAFRPAGDDKASFTGPDHAGGGDDGLHARGTQPVHGHSRHALWQARQQQGHPRDITVVLAGLVGGAEDHLIHGRPVEVGMARHQRPDRVRCKIIGPHGGQRAAEPADGRTLGITDKHIGHWRLLTGSVWVMPRHDCRRGLAAPPKKHGAPDPQDRGLRAGSRRAVLWRHLPWAR